MLTDLVSYKLFKYQQSVFLSLLWAAALFETGLPGIPGVPGVTIFMISAWAMIGTVCIEVFMGARRVTINALQLSPVKLLTAAICLLYFSLTLFGSVYSGTYLVALIKSLRLLWFIMLALFSIFVLTGVNRDEAITVFGRSGFIALIVLFGLTFFSASSTPANTISIFRDYNTYSVHLIVASLLTIVYVQKIFARHQWLGYVSYAGIFGLLTYILLLSNSRRGIIFLAVPVTLVIISFYFQQKKIRPLILVGLIMVLALSYIFMPYMLVQEKFSTIQRFIASMQDQGLAGLVVSRTGRLNIALDIIGDMSWHQLLLGGGTSSLRQFYGPGDHPHNFFFNAVLEGGLIKATALIILLGLLATLSIQATIHMKTLYERVFGISTIIMYIITISISAEDGLTLKLFWLLLLFFWTLCPDSHNKKSSQELSHSLQSITSSEVQTL